MGGELLIFKEFLCFFGFGISLKLIFGRTPARMLSEECHLLE